MLLIECGYAAMGAEYDMIYEMGIAHGGAKVSILSRLRNPRPSMGSPPATMPHIAIPAVPPLPFAALRLAAVLPVTQMAALRASAATPHRADLNKNLVRLP